MDLHKELIKEFPILFSSDLVRYSVKNPGWDRIIYGLCSELQEWSDRTNNPLVLYYIKDSAEGLLVKTNMDESPEIADMITMYARITQNYCELCSEDFDVTYLPNQQTFLCAKCRQDAI